MQNFIANKNLFLTHICSDARDEYARAVAGEVELWDLVLITASNEAQAAVYSRRLEDMVSRGRLPAGMRTEVVADPGGLRVGSGGATLNALDRIRSDFGGDCFSRRKILLIHSGGDSKRTPQYSVCGKLFSPVPRLLHGSTRSTLFDELMVSAAGIARHMDEGMLVLSGDVLTVFNPLQADFRCGEALALSVRAPVSVGERHGVFVPDENGLVGSFLHKLPADRLRAAHAVDDTDEVCLDVGAVILSPDIIRSLLSLISTGSDTDDAKLAEFVNDRVRLNFYGDFLYPMSSRATLEEYLAQAPELEFSDALTRCRLALWDALSRRSMRLLTFSPSAFICFDSSRELLRLMTDDSGGYAALGCEKLVNTNFTGTHAAVNNSLIEPSARVGRGCYIENSRLGGTVSVGEGCVVSCSELTGVDIPAHTLVHTVKLSDGRFVARIIGVGENPKEPCLRAGAGGTALWDAKLFPACRHADEAVRESLKIYLGARAEGADEYFSLSSSFNLADADAEARRESRLFDEIRVRMLLDCAERRDSGDYAARVFADNPLSARQLELIAAELPKLADFDRIRVCFLLSKLADGSVGRDLEARGFGLLRDMLVGERPLAVRRGGSPDEVSVVLPLRVNWGGGWTDTPPYCLENGGAVLNAAVKIGGRLPARVSVERLEEPVIILACSDSGSSRRFTDLAPLRSCTSPFDSFSLHKAALMTAGAVPLDGGSFGDVLERMGGGLRLTTGVVGIPRGSGLGTSSILSGACLVALRKYLGLDIDEQRVYNDVLCSEQLMGTGGGWQDQIGGMTGGIKLITSLPGIPQRFEVRRPDIPGDALDELCERFCLIYTGQRRLARNHLRRVVVGYMSGDSRLLTALGGIKALASDMSGALSAGDIDSFAELLNEHWSLSREVDDGCRAECIDAIFSACAPLISGRMICGAGGGGFLQVILRRGVSARELRGELLRVFGSGSAEVYDSEFCFDSPLEYFRSD